MWTIRQEQVDTFQQTALRKFEDEMVEHMNKFAPQHCKVAGEPAVREVIRMAITEGGKYRFTNRGPLRFYTELMFMFGVCFDTDPQYPWATATLGQSENLDESVLADRLFSEMNQYLDKVSGPDHRYLIEAMRRLSKLRMEDFLVPGKDVKTTILAKLSSVYPQKCEYLGEAVLRRLMEHAFKLAEESGVATDRGRVLMSAFTFAMGHGFSKDPLNGWIRRRLQDSRWPTPEERVEELYSKSLLFLSRNIALMAESKN